MSTRDDPADVIRFRAWQDSQARQAAAHAHRARQLAGSRTARAALADAWSAVKPDRRYPEQSPTPTPAPPVS